MSTGVTLQKNFRVGDFPSKGSFSGKGIPSGMIQACTFATKPGSPTSSPTEGSILVDLHAPDANGYLNLTDNVNSDFAEVQTNNLHLKVARTIYIAVVGAGTQTYQVTMSGYDISGRQMVCSGNAVAGLFEGVRAFASLQSIQISNYAEGQTFEVLVTNEFALPYNSDGNLTFLYQISTSNPTLSGLGITTESGSLPLSAFLKGTLKPGIANKPFGDTGLPAVQTANSGLSTDQLLFTGTFPDEELVFTFGFNAEGYGCQLVYPKFMDPNSVDTVPQNSLETTLGVAPYNTGWTAWR